MIYQTIRATLEQLPALQPVRDEDGEEQGRVYPPGVCIDDVTLPIAVYARGECAEVVDLCGRVHHYSEQVTVDILAKTYDEVQELSWAAEKALRALGGTETEDAYVFGVQITVPEPDGADADLELQRRSLRLTVQWCPLEEVS